MKAGVKKHNMYDAPSGIPASGANIRLRFVGFKKKNLYCFYANRSFNLKMK